MSLTFCTFVHCFLEQSFFFHLLCPSQGIIKDGHNTFGGLRDGDVLNFSTYLPVSEYFLAFDSFSPRITDLEFRGHPYLFLLALWFSACLFRFQNATRHILQIFYKTYAARWTACLFMSSHLPFVPRLCLLSFHLFPCSCVGMHTKPATSKGNHPIY